MPLGAVPQNALEILAFHAQGQICLSHGKLLNSSSITSPWDSPGKLRSHRTLLYAALFRIVAFFRVLVFVRRPKPIFRANSERALA